ncbi:MAG: mandelate racemase/muconate lactonizing enzyme family protein [Gammaproteobacteria bacterium]|nr:mandelate racemase/muconate lactonizing enzyme family protein [Gammaproteobacteria bacterium]MBT8105149.1 mandelate racemase/muconate lactonizing enzyme family protein [Gammaproteobacteria bacterium]NNK25163.1 mandelate racemase/muconate lactonizing enzyme family protein [Woeseiaceae bacterium]
MKISAIRVYQVDLPLVEGRYSWSEGKYVEVFDSTVVELVTDDGLSGYGEVCPLGPFYLPAFGPGARAGIGELSATLLGQDPTALGPINQLMDMALLGHPYVKSAIDMACWDLLGKVTGKSVCDLMGGKFGDSVTLYRAISQRPTDEMAENVAAHRKDGYTRFQLKVGGNPGDDIDRIHAVADILTEGEVLVADANTGWRVDDAIRVVNAVRDRDVYIEQPCRSYEHCLTVRRRTSLPFILDENIDGIDALLRGHADGAMDVINLKISKVGGLTRARQIRDLCVTLNLPMTIEDSWGGDIITAAIAHLAHSTPEWLRFSATDFNSYVTVRNASGAPTRTAGHMKASDEPGLGITPDMAVLGKPVAEYT